ncbi:thiamine-phosphate pyrophosphorylase [Roseovarius nanhaiticus]|uniref:Thiamine-phosphate pyrophosphorylase n=1 Tax=Roseovarius nanhaiticus TaxID=573024 RepID=A0A1N7HGW3_9RHOB|nr:thiamine phosphate synthase [Roseovarius nanhaiticus]SEK94863.1 thiamine-phosphate pyrophosphorylase [Roseovarius nanhaiticus]SIS24117.1 thiamine-phosphate pyrophosphorylase [Roseovarius nanhaiticus]
MSDQETPQIYLITPPDFELSQFTTQLAAVLDAHEVACLRLALASHDEDRIARAADACREIAHARDVAVVLQSHISLSERLGLDGVHLMDGARSVRKARKALGPDAIVGAYCAQTRHEGMSAGEAGADYVAFGPAGASGLGDGAQAEDELFKWWSEMIEIPVVAEGALDATRIGELAQLTDFFGIGDEIWAEDDPAAALGTLIRAMG